MKKLPKSLNTKKYASILSIAAFAVVGTSLLIFSRAATPPAAVTNLSAGSATFSLTTVGGANHLKDSTFDVAIYEDSGSQAVLGVDLDLNFDQSKLQLQPTISSAGSSFPQCPDRIAGAGKLTLYCITDFLGNPPVTSVTGKKLIATVTFKALVGGNAQTTVGIAKVSADRSSIKEASAGANVWDGDTTKASATYTLTDASTPPPTTPPPTTPPPTGGGTTTTGGTSSGGTKKTTTPASPSSGSTALNNSPTTTAPTTSETTPQTDSSGVVAIVVADASGKPVSGVSVTLGSQTVVTDTNGIASFIGIAPGRYKLEAKGVLGVATKNITVTSAGASPTQAQKFDLVLKKKTNIAFYAGIVIVLALVGLLLFMGRRWFRNRSYKTHSSPSTRDSVVVNGKDIASADSEPVMPTLTMAKPADDALSIKSKLGIADTDTLADIEKKAAPDKGTVVEIIPSDPSSQPGKSGSEPQSGQIITPNKSN